MVSQLASIDRIHTMKFLINTTLLLLATVGARRHVSEKFPSPRRTLTTGPAVEEDASPGKGGKGKGKKKSKKNVNLMCKAWQVFDNMIRPNHKGPDVFDWPSVCDEFEPLDELLCPSSKSVDTICKHRNPQLNPAVNHTYCHSLLEDMDEGDVKDDCLLACVNYVSKDRGDCCDIACVE